MAAMFLQHPAIVSRKQLFERKVSLKKADGSGTTSAECGYQGC
jgi:hypothetical protein